MSPVRVATIAAAVALLLSSCTSGPAAVDPPVGPSPQELAAEVLREDVATVVETLESYGVSLTTDTTTPKGTTRTVVGGVAERAGDDMVSKLEISVQIPGAPRDQDHGYVLDLPKRTLAWAFEDLPRPEGLAYWWEVPKGADGPLATKVRALTGPSLVGVDPNRLAEQLRHVTTAEAGRPDFFVGVKATPYTFEVPAASVAAGLPGNWTADGPARVTVAVDSLNRPVQVLTEIAGRTPSGPLTRTVRFVPSLWDMPVNIELPTPDQVIPYGGTGEQEKADDDTTI